MRVIKEHGRNVNSTVLDDSPLIAACKVANIDKVRGLLKNREDAITQFLMFIHILRHVPLDIIPFFIDFFPNVLLSKGH